MGCVPKKHQAERLLRGGLDPSQIADELGVDDRRAVQYLLTRVGEGALRHSDIYFSWSSDKREVLQRLVEGGKVPDATKSKHRILAREVKLFHSLRRSRVFDGDMYHFVSSLEIELHDRVRKVLVGEFGEGEMEWWRKGIPEQIRKRCAIRREEDEEVPTEPYGYTTLLDLATIIEKNWNLFPNDVPKAYGSNRKQLGRDFRRLNRIRNAVMHPVKARKWTFDDFEFVRNIASAFDALDG